VADVYGDIGPALDRFWWDEAHVDNWPAGALASALLARHLRDARWPNEPATAANHD
jgi:hypothetical protein